MPSPDRQTEYWDNDPINKHRDNPEVQDQLRRLRLLPPTPTNLEAHGMYIAGLLEAPHVSDEGQ